MKRYAVAACLIAGLALPVCAQHGGGHGGGGGGHAAPSFHGGSSGGGSRRFSAPARSFAPPRSAARPRMMARNPYGAPTFRRGLRPVYPGYTNRAGGPFYPNRPGDFNRNHYRGPYISSYWPNYWGVYPYIWPGYPTMFDYGDDYDSDQGPVANYGDYGDNGYPGTDNEGYGDQGYGPQQPPPAWPSLGPYAPQYGPTSAQPAAPPSSEEAVTLIFKDGRPAEQIHNYVLTPTILYAGDAAHRQVIPIDQLDIPATEKVNADAGVDFHLPQMQVQTLQSPGYPDAHVLSPQ